MRRCPPVARLRREPWKATLAREDWHMLQKIFVADLDPDRLAQRQGEADSAAQEGPPAEPGSGQRGGRLAR